MPRPGELDATLGEFWVENPWQIAAGGFNLSCYERDRTYLSLGGKEFLEISHLTSADNEGDGRAIVAADFRNTGMMDLLLRQAGGGPLVLYENRLPRKHYLKVSLRGSTSNRQGIGARLVATVGGRRIVRELFPANSFLSQAPCMSHFGLGDQQEVSNLSIRWPSGKEQVLTNIKCDQHILIDESKEGALAITPVIPGSGAAY